MKRISRLLPICLGAIVLLSACTMPTPTPCPPAMLVAPNLISPANWAVVPSLTPTLTWTYPTGPSPYPYPYPASSCTPSSYRVYLSTGPDFSDELGGVVSGTSFTPSSPLQPGKEYQWGVRAQSGGGDGPFAGSRYFFTGPLCECSAASLVAPTLIAPSGTVTDLNPTLKWDYPADCAAPSYRVDLSTDPSFSDTSLSGGTGNPSTRWGPGDELADCTTYYWRIAVACDLPGGGTILGPWSATQSFNTAAGPCLSPFMPDLPYFITEIDANCRLGPSTQYPKLATAFEGIQYPVIGRNGAGDWFYIHLRDDLDCWVADLTGEFHGDPGKVAEEEAPPLPPPDQAPEYNSCSDYPDFNTCAADPEHFGNCYWDRKYNQCRSQ